MKLKTKTNQGFAFCLMSLAFGIALLFRNSPTRETLIPIGTRVVIKNIQDYEWLPDGKLLEFEFDTGPVAGSIAQIYDVKSGDFTPLPNIPKANNKSWSPTSCVSPDGKWYLSRFRPAANGLHIR